MSTIDELEKQWRIVSDGTSCAVHNVAVTPAGRAILLGTTPLSLETRDPDELRELLAALPAAATRPVLQQEQIITPEFYEGARFVVQERHYYNDYPTYTDLKGEDGLPLGFATKEAAEAHIETILDSEYEEAQKRYETDRARADKAEELFQARRALLEEHNLWDEHALATKTWRAPRPAVRGTAANYSVVQLEESEWASEY